MRARIEAGQPAASFRSDIAKFGQRPKLIELGSGGQDCLLPWSGDKLILHRARGLQLGLQDSPQLMDAINSVIETYGRSERNKYRAVVYYMLVKHFGKESVYN